MRDLVLETRQNVAAASATRGEEVTAREIAEQIVNEDVRDEHGGYAYWIDNHSCGGYGCCGGGKEIDKPALTNIIERAIAVAIAVQTREVGLAAFQAGFDWAINGTDLDGGYNGGTCEEGYDEFLLALFPTQKEK
jgi:hypothetical protein